MAWLLKKLRNWDLIFFKNRIQAVIGGTGIQVFHEDSNLSFIKSSVNVYSCNVVNANFPKDWPVHAQKSNYQKAKPNY